ncbi:hypothetical protein Drorol1_Dr00027734 [Drosera rotundifolia]
MEWSCGGRRCKRGEEVSIGEKCREEVRGFCEFVGLRSVPVPTNPPLGALNRNVTTVNKSRYLTKTRRREEEAMRAEGLRLAGEELDRTQGQRPATKRRRQQLSKAGGSIGGSGGFSGEESKVFVKEEALSRCGKLRGEAK